MLEIFYEETEDLNLDSGFFVKWFIKTTALHNKQLGDLNIIFCSDDYLLEMNQQHLSHDYFTDIISFDYTVDNIIGGDLFISVDRVRDNATIHNTSFEDELHRVSIHGLLHLCGFKDKTDEDSALMRSKEDEALSLRFT
jgi:probable rRNA maturation factor